MIPQYPHIKGVKIFDSTPREGFQTPGVGASLDERVEIVKNLRKVYGDDKAVIELGMPANEVDYPIVRAIMEREKGPQYAFLLRCHDLDVSRARETFASYSNNMAHLFIGTSEAHRGVRFKGQYSIEDYCNLIKEKIRDVASDPNVMQVMFSPEDSTRTFWEQLPDVTEHEKGEVLMRFIEAAKQGYDDGNKEVGRDYPMIFNLPDTIGIGIPEENRAMLGTAHRIFGEGIDLSVHFHNDIDCATAQTIDAVTSGYVKFPQVCFSGSGERNGIGKAEPVIVALNERGILNFTDEQSAQLTSTSRNIGHLMGLYLDPRYPVSGPDVNVSTAGIHTQAAARNPNTYHYMGAKYGNPVRLLFGTTSGSDTAKSFLERQGFQFSQDQLMDYSGAMKSHANQIKNYLTETEMHIIAEEIINGRSPNHFTVLDYEVNGTRSEGDSEVKLAVVSDGKPFFWRGQGVGPVDAAMNALKQNVGYNCANLTTFRPAIKGMGAGAEMQVTSVIDYDGQQYWGRGISDSVTFAPVDSVIDAFHNMHFLRNT